MTSPIDPDDQMLAAEYVLRLQDEDTRQSTHARLRSDAGFADLVSGWRDTFGRLDDQFEDETPNPALKTAIMLHLFGAEPQKTAPFWDRIAVWRFATALCLVAAFGLGALLYTERPDQTTTLYVAELASENDALRILAVYDATSNQVQLTRTAGQAGQGRSLQLWGISDGAAPVSIGVLPDDFAGSWTLPAQLTAQLDGLVLAISDEPSGGSPTGQPTGDVLAVSGISKL